MRDLSSPPLDSFASRHLPFLAWFRRPSFPNDEEKTLQAQITHNILSIALFFSFAIVPITIFAQKEIPFAEPIVLAVCLTGLWLVHRGQVHLAASSFLALATIATLGSLFYFREGVNSPALYIYILIVLSTGLIFGRKWAMYSAIFGGVFASFVFFSQYYQLISLNTPIDLATHWLIAVILFFMTALTVGLSNDVSQKARQKQRTAEQALRAIQAQLEKRVEERTLALQEQSEELERKNKELEKNAQILEINSERLRKALQSRETFLAMMSHELRSPLNNILGICQILQMRLARIPPETLKTIQNFEDHIHTIQNSGEHLKELIEDILTLSKYEAGHLALSLQIASLRQICEQSLQIIQQQAHQKHLTLHRELQQTDILLECDAKRLRQMIVNLLSNAVKFTPEGGEIGIRVQCDEESIQIAVWDKGIGIREEDRERIFKPFEQVDNDLSRSNEGTGLGLPLAHRLAALHGGGLAMESTLSQGSCFTIHLPASLKRESKLQSKRSQDIALYEDLSAYRLMLVEDREETAKIMGEFFDLWRLPWFRAKDGFQAVQLAQEKQPDLILMDVQMPGMDGLTAIREIREKESNGKPIPILVLTALALPGDRERCLAAGADDYCTKPFSTKYLYRKLREFLPTPAPSASSQPPSPQESPQPIPPKNIAASAIVTILFFLFFSPTYSYAARDLRQWAKQIYTSFQKGKLPQALQEVESAQEAIGARPLLLYYKGMIHQAMQQDGEAIAAYRQAQDGLDAPMLPWLYNNLGNLYFRQQRYRVAARYYAKALALNPSYERARYNLEVAIRRLQSPPPPPPPPKSQRQPPPPPNQRQSKRPPPPRPKKKDRVIAPPTKSKWALPPAKAFQLKAFDRFLPYSKILKHQQQVKAREKAKP
jgi:signal transduction histidine kinase/tetratricopeptide (TPR) repeat protein